MAEEISMPDLVKIDPTEPRPMPEPDRSEIELSARDFELMMERLEDPGEPSEALKRLAERYDEQSA